MLKYSSLNCNFISAMENNQTSTFMYINTVYFNKLKTVL